MKYPFTYPRKLLIYQIYPVGYRYLLSILIYRYLYLNNGYAYISVIILTNIGYTYLCKVHVISTCYFVFIFFENIKRVKQLKLSVIYSATETRYFDLKFMFYLAVTNKFSGVINTCVLVIFVLLFQLSGVFN